MYKVLHDKCVKLLGVSTPQMEQKSPCDHNRIINNKGDNFHVSVFVLNASLIHNNVHIC